MNTEGQGFTEQQWEVSRAKIEESQAFILVLAKNSADFFRAKIVNATKSSTEIFRDFLPSVERVSWLYGQALTDGSHTINVEDMAQFQYVDANGQSFFASEVGTVVVSVLTHADGTIALTGFILNVQCNRSDETVTVNGTFAYHGPA